MRTLWHQTGQAAAVRRLQHPEILLQGLPGERVESLQGRLPGGAGGTGGATRGGAGVAAAAARAEAEAEAEAESEAEAEGR
jgi:hypothetical protein